MKEYETVRVFSKTEVEDLMKQAVKEKLQTVASSEELRVRFRMELAKIPVELAEVEVLRELI